MPEDQPYLTNTCIEMIHPISATEVVIANYSSEVSISPKISLSIKKLKRRMFSGVLLKSKKLLFWYFDITLN